MKPLFREWDDWKQHKACSFRPELFFLQYKDDGDDYYVDEAKAKQYCESCPARARCEDYAVFGKETEGIWGGKNPDELRKIRAKNAKSLPFFIREIDEAIELVVDDFMLAMDILNETSKVQAL